ncbi:MAG: hypothetical protein QOE90_234 [Thermoplasmata archaeon]|nr:hypothetical protein [Thermoplasmata archaeon]
MDWPTLDTFARRPRDALMWLPRAADVARIAAALRVAGPRVADVGAGTGLLAALLAREGVRVEASDAAPPAKRYHEVATRSADHLPACDAAIVSWMEAGRDYREAVARVAPVVVNVYDVEGGCGVMGAVDFAPFGFREAATWRTASFEDAAFALDRKGRLKRKGHPGNRVDVLSRDPALVAPLADAVAQARVGPPLPWEAAMDEVGL